MWLSLVGAILCVAVMFLTSKATALITFAVVLALYLIVAYRKPGKKRLGISKMCMVISEGTLRLFLFPKMLTGDQQHKPRPTRKLFCLYST